MKKLFSLFAVVMLAVMSLNLNTLTVSAEEPVTYNVKYNAEKNEWWYQLGSYWDSNYNGMDMYFMMQDLKDGDHVIVEGTAGEQELHLNVNLGSLTIISNASCSVYANGVQNCYILSGAFANIHSNVTNAYMYDFSVANFYNDCTNLDISYTDLSTIAVAVIGKCSNFKVHTDDNSTTKYQLYNFKAPLIFENSAVQNDASEYDTTPTASSSTPTTTTTPAAPSASDEYDDVPKTGESSLYLVAFGFAALCFAGSYALKKRA